MASRDTVIREALSEMENQRARNLRTEQERREEAREKSAEIAALLDERQTLLFSGMRGAFSAPGDAKRIAETMRLRMEELNVRLRAALAANGFPADYLQPVFRCALCRDTGYVGEPVHEQCSCLRRAVMLKLYESEGLQNLENENFAQFNELVFPDEPIEGRKNTQRSFMRKVREHCEGYADSFASGEGRGLVLMGKTGRGKTYLMNCIAQRVLERGFSVVIISAYKLVETMRRYQFDGEGEAQVADLLACDLLCIDDLGSEPMLRNVTLSAIYHIVNERRSAKKAMIVTTNCDSEQLYEKYDDRIAARLTDPGRMTVINFIGVDVRRFAGK